LTPVIFLLLLVSPLLRKRYSARLRSLMWLALAVRMLVPINTPLQNAVQIHLFPGYETETFDEGLWLYSPIIIESTQDEAGAAAEAPTQEAAEIERISITPVILVISIWAAGIALFLLYHAGAYAYTLRRLRRWSVSIRDEDTLRRFTAVKEELSIKTCVRLYQSVKAASPLVIGFLRPLLVLPETPLTTEQLDFMLRHELCHLKRRDLWCKLLMLLANAVHWFNPFVWLMTKRAALDVELACDAEVLAGKSRAERRAYGYTVLSFIEQGWRGKTPLTSKFYGGNSQMKQRFYNITDSSSKKRGTLVLCMVVLMITLASTAVYAAVPENSTVPSAPVTVKDQKPNILTEVSEEEQTPLEDSETMVWPVPDYNTITSVYGIRYNGADFHTGVDVSGKDIYGAEVIAAKSGTVIATNTEYTPGLGYGIYVVIDHGDNLNTLYAQLSEILVEVGDDVKIGQPIAKVGSSGFSSAANLHFEVRESGTHVDPLPYLPVEGNESKK
jgi:beta-lactamase regulating signal transducer with metallopeptidase domain